MKQCAQLRQCVSEPLLSLWPGLSPRTMRWCSFFNSSCARYSTHRRMATRARTHYDQWWHSFDFALADKLVRDVKITLGDGHVVLKHAWPLMAYMPLAAPHSKLALQASHRLNRRAVPCADDVIECVHCPKQSDCLYCMHPI